MAAHAAASESCAGAVSCSCARERSGFQQLVLIQTVGPGWVSGFVQIGKVLLKGISCLAPRTALRFPSGSFLGVRPLDEIRLELCPGSPLPSPAADGCSS